MTKRDQALEKYLQDENKQAQYYDLIINGDFYIPLNMDGAKNTGTEQESVTPLVLKLEQKHYMLLFDSKERLSAWAKKPTNFVVLTGWKAAEISRPQLHWAINVGSGRSKEFLPEEIVWLKQRQPESVE